MAAADDEARIAVFLYENIDNMAEVKDLVMKGQLQLSVVNPTLVYHADQLMWAAHKSLYNAGNKQLKTKTVYTELLYNLYPSRSIRDSLKTLGVQDKSRTALFVMFSKAGEEFPNGMKSAVKGDSVPLDRLGSVRNVEAIRKLYKVPQHVSSDEDDLLNFLISKMACKDLLF